VWSARIHGHAEAGGGGQPISCSFRQAAGAPKTVCWVGDNDVTESLLGQGWAELAEGVTEESYVEAEASARRIKAGIWGDAEGGALSATAIGKEQSRTASSYSRGFARYE